MTGADSHIAGVSSVFYWAEWGFECHKFFVLHKKELQTCCTVFVMEQKLSWFLPERVGRQITGGSFHTKAAPHFSTYLWSCRGAFVLWNGWHSAPKISSPWSECALTFGLASFTVCTAGIVGLQHPEICVNINYDTQQNPSVWQLCR